MREVKKKNLSFRTACSPKLDLPCDSFPQFDLSQLNEYECSAQILQCTNFKFFSVSENRILFIIAMSAFFDKAEVI